MVLTASETRKQARESLKGKWGVVVLITLVYLVYNFLVCVLSTIPVLGFLVDIAALVIGIPIIYGFVMTMMKLKRGENVGYFDFFKDGFNNFKRAWCVTGRLLLKMIAPIILVIVALVIMVVSIIATFATAFTVGSSSALGGAVVGVSALTIVAYIVIIAAYVWLFIKSLTYGLCMFIAIDNPDMRPADCVNKSKELMDGNKGRLFCLYLSFIGWIALAAVLSLIPFVGVIVPFLACLVLVPYIEYSAIIFYENKAGMDSSATVAEGTVSTDSTDNAAKEETNSANEASANNTNSDANNTANTIKEKSGSTDVKAEIVDIPDMDDKDE